MHRASNTDDPARAGAMFSAFRQLRCRRHPWCSPCIRARDATTAALPDDVHMIEPVGYLDMVGLVRGDGHRHRFGRVAEGAAWLGTPCVTMRDQTEWVETVSSGWNRIVGADTKRIVDAVRAATPPPAQPFDRYGGDDASARVVRTILARFC